MNRDEVIKRAQVACDDEGEYAVAIWSDSDVLSCAEEMGEELTREEAKDIIRQIHSRQDANVGIDWTVIETHISMFLTDKQSA